MGSGDEGVTPSFSTNFMQTFLFYTTWFLALLLPASSLSLVIYIAWANRRDDREALKEIKSAGLTGIGRRG
jgi:hypothetical protein